MQSSMDYESVIHLVYQTFASNNFQIRSNSSYRSRADFSQILIKHNVCGTFSGAKNGPPFQ